MAEDFMTPHPLWLRRLVDVLIFLFALTEIHLDEACDSRDCATCLRKRMKRRVS
jgi:hypothetical protein